MFNKLILINIFSLTIVLASSPAKPGVTASQKVQQFTSIMAVDYHQGGLVAKMQRIKDANIQNAENGNRDLREDVYMSFPVILGSYADYDDLDTVRSLLQQELFDGPWTSPTMAEHYAEMSYDQFHLSGTVYGWYALGSNSDFYEGAQSEPYDNGFNGPPGGAGEFLKDALDLADLEIDFTQYDNDGPDGVANSGDDDGFVDAAFFAHSGRGGEGGGPYIWSHRWTYSGWWGSAYTTNDMGANGTAIRVNDYIMQPASGTNGGLIQIGVFSHEFGHALGLPDLYDTDYSSDGVGSWCLMASGSWSTPSSPTHMSAWCKEMLGWIIPIIPDENEAALDFLNVEENGFAVKLWTHGELDPYVGYYSHNQDVGREYFLIENRQRIGTEQHIPGTGLLIWHIDNSQYNNNDENHYMVDLKAADGYFNGSNPGDPWPGSTNNRNFDFGTIPSAVGWAGINTEVALLNVSDSDTTMSADVEVHEVTPHIAISDMIISDDNGDNIFSPGEYVQIWLTVENTGGSTSNLTATLSADGAPVNINEAVIDFDPIDFSQTVTSNLPFEFEVSDTLTPQIVTFDISFSADELPEPDHAEIRLMLGTPDLAVIDDDGVVSGTGDYLAYYGDALRISDEVHAVWDIEASGVPSLEWLQANSKVIWYTGNNPAPLNESKIDLISDYLENGGKILMSGQDISHGGIEVENFLDQYFAVEVTSHDVNSTYVYGNTDHEMMDAADHYSISHSAAAHNQNAPDGFTVREGGASLFVYPFTGDLTCGSSLKTATYSSILLGFGLEALSGFSGDPDTVRSDLINRMLAWLDLTYTSIDEVHLNLPGTGGIVAAYPNPFNPAIQFEVQLQGAESGELQITDIRGARVKKLTVNKSGLVNWQPANERVAGLYFVNLIINGKVAGGLHKVTYLK